MEDKTQKYYSETRPELLDFYPKDIRRLLDVGCSSANFSASLKARSNVEVWGIEMNVAAAEEAKKKIDKVFIGDLCEIIKTLPLKNFDCIGFNDILEHLYDPWQVLRDIKANLTSDGVVVASIPSFLEIKNLFKLIGRKEWEYTKEGTLDFTHVRFFTKKSMIRMFVDCGYRVIRIEGINPKTSIKWKVFNLLTFGFFSESSYLQFVCIAKPA